MAKKPEGLTFKEHQRIGKQILKLRQDLKKLDIKIADAYGKTSKSAKQAEKLLNDLALLQTELNKRLCEENRTSSNLELLACYYPKA
jgi:septal ring factor EnvC (AmiA/AmiB activator)